MVANTASHREAVLSVGEPRTAKSGCFCRLEGTVFSLGIRFGHVPHYGGSPSDHDRDAAIAYPA